MHVNRLRHFFFFALLLLGVGGACWGKSEAWSSLKGKRTISFNTGYLTGQKDLSWSNSNRALSVFFQEVGQLHGALFDGLAYACRLQKYHALKGVLALVDWAAGHFLFAPLPSVVYHEFGHFSRGKAMGYIQPVFLNESYSDGDPKRYSKGFEDPFAYTWHQTFRAYKGKGATHRGYGLRFVPSLLTRGLPDDFAQGMKDAVAQDPSHGQAQLDRYIADQKVAAQTDPSLQPALDQYERNERDKDIATIAAGMNNEMRLAGDLTDAAYAGQGHISDMWVCWDVHRSAVTYPEDKKDGSSFPKGDVSRLLQFYKEKGWSFSKKDLDTANWLSLFLSSTTYAYLWSWGKFARYGTTDVKAFEVFGVRVPDVENYLLIEGLSYKVKTGYRLNQKVHFPVAIEFLTKGASGAEISLGGEVLLGTQDVLWNLGGSVLFGRAFGFETHARFTLNALLFFEGGVELMDQRSFYGQRNIPSLEKGNTAWAFWVRGGFCY